MSRKPPHSMYRKVWEPRNTILSNGPWAWPYVDRQNWWMDAWQTEAWRYLHAPVHPPPEYGDRVTRVYPREKKGYTVRLAMRAGELYWLYDLRDWEPTEAVAV